MDVYKSEKEQWEEVKTWLKENVSWIIAGVILGAGLIYGYRFWVARETRMSIEAHAHFGNVLNALYSNKKDDALKELAVLDNDYGRTPYGDQARLQFAAWYVNTGKLDGAIAPLTQVMNDSRDETLRLVARLRIARILAEQQKPDDALKMLGNSADNAFDPRYREVRGDILLSKGDRAGALAEYQAAAQSKVPGIVNDDLLKLKIADLADVAKDKAP